MFWMIYPPSRGDADGLPSMENETHEDSRRAILAAPGEVRIERQASPEPGPGQVRVRLQGCGVCASSLPVWEGREWFDHPQPAGSPGQEGWGVVVAVGPGVEGPAPGTRVAVLSQHAFADHDLADAATAVPLPGVLDGRPFPGEPLACAFNAFHRSGIEAGQRVAVLGTGFLGSVLTGLATAGRRPGPAPLGRESSRISPPADSEPDPRGPPGGPAVHPPARWSP